MKNMFKNIVLCLIGLVLTMTLMTTAFAVPNMFITTSAVINEDAEVLPVTFRINNDGGTELTEIYTIVAIPVGTNILTSDSVDMSITETTAANSEAVYSFNLPLRSNLEIGTYTVNVAITGTTTSDTENITVIITGAETPMAPWLIEEIDFEDEVAPEDEVEVEVNLETAEGETYEDVTIEAWIEDADGDRLSEKDETGEFNIGKFSDDDEKTKVLTLEIPENADEGEYYVVVRVEGENDGRKGLLAYDDTNEITVERNDHSVKILYLHYDEEVEAGDVVDFAVGLLNNGREDETVRVNVNVIGLDASQTSGDIEVQVDEYAPAYFSLAIPEDADEDDYTVKVSVYNDEIDFTETYTIEITEGAGMAIGGLAVGADATSKQISAEGGVYLISLTNNEASTRTFTMEVTGASTWADYSVNPATVSVAPGTSQIVSVYLSPKADVSGAQTFTVNVKEGATVVESVGLTAQVTEGAGITSIITTGLQWLVAVLIVIAIVLGIAWAFKREK